jgi:hypothetical protein
MSHTPDRHSASGDSAPATRDGSGRFVRGLDSAQRDTEAIRMLSQGCTYQEVSDALGYGGSGNACRAVKRALAELPAREVAELRQIAGERLDRLTREAFAVLDHDHLTISQGGKVVRDDDGNLVHDDGPKLAAIDRLLRIEERRARLYGMDAPTKFSATLSPQEEWDRRDAEIEQEIERLKAVLRAEEAAGEN